MALAVEWLPEEWPEGIPNLKQLLVVAPLTTSILLLFGCRNRNLRTVSPILERVASPRAHHRAMQRPHPRSERPTAPRDRAGEARASRQRQGHTPSQPRTPPPHPPPPHATNPDFHTTA